MGKTNIKTSLKFIFVIVLVSILMNSFLQLIGVIIYLIQEETVIKFFELPLWHIIFLNIFLITFTVIPDVFYYVLKYAAFEESLLRGFALPRLQASIGYFSTNIVLGLFSALVRIVIIFIVSDRMELEVVYQIMFYIIPSSFIYGSLYVQSSHNLLVCIFLNAYGNALFGLREVSGYINWFLIPAIMPSLDYLANNSKLNGINLYTNLEILINFCIAALILLNITRNDKITN